MRYITDRKRAQGLGSGRAGTHHHWQMLVSSVMLCVLAPLFIITFVMGFGGTYEEVLAYFSQPIPAIITGLMLVVAIRHFLYEVLEAIEDYVHGVKGKLLMMAASAFSYTLIAAGLLALVKIAL